MNDWARQDRREWFNGPGRIRPSPGRIDGYEKALALSGLLSSKRYQISYLPEIDDADDHPDLSRR